MIFIFKWAIFKVSRQLSGVYTLEIKHWYQKIMVWKMYLLWQMANVLVSMMFNCYPHLPNPWVFQMVFLKWSKLLCVEGRNILLWSNALLVVRIFTWNTGYTTANRCWRSWEFPRPFPKVFFSEGKWQFFLPICDFSLSINENWWICINVGFCVQITSLLGTSH